MDTQILNMLQEIKNDISVMSKRLDNLENQLPLSDAFPQNEEVQKLIKKEFMELKKWVKVEVSDRLYNNMDNNDTMIIKKVVEGGDILGDMLVNLDKKINDIGSQVNKIDHTVDAMPRGMS